MSELTDDRLREIVAGCEGVTPGPWRRPPKTPYVNRDPGPYPGDAYGSVTVAECGDWKDSEIAPFNKDRWMADAAHIARLDPDTVKAICTELLALRAAASTSTEGAGVIEALRTLTSAVENMRVPQNIAEAAMQVELTIGPALRSAQDVLRALTPPASKVTTQERNA